MVPRVEPRNKTVRFLWGPASVSTTIDVNWYLETEIIKKKKGESTTFPILSWLLFFSLSFPFFFFFFLVLQSYMDAVKQLSHSVYRPIVLTTQGLCPSSGTVSSMSGWVLTKFSTSSGSVVEELNLDPCTAHPPGLQTEGEVEKQSERKARGDSFFFIFWRQYQNIW